MNTTQGLRKVTVSKPKRWDKWGAQEGAEGQGDRQEDQETDGDGRDTASDGRSWGDQDSDKVGLGWETWV